MTQIPFEDGELLKIPDIPCPFPSQISPHLEQVRRHTLEWVQRFHLVQKKNALQNYLAANFAGFSCRVYSMGKLEELIFINDWVS